MNLYQMERLIKVEKVIVYTLQSFGWVGEDGLIESCFMLKSMSVDWMKLFCFYTNLHYFIAVVIVFDTVHAFQ